MKLFFGTLVVAAAVSPVAAASSNSFWAYQGLGGRMIRQPDALGNRVLDYSGVGYRGGTEAIPFVAARTNLSPVAGDDGLNIQAAIDYVATLPLDADGFRGAVQLSAGEYQISNSITISADGIVLRGAGDGSDTNSSTILRATYVGTNHPALVVISGSAKPSAVSGTTHNITDLYVPAGARSFNVDSTGGLSVGARVFVHRPSTADWITALGMDQLEFPWTAGSMDLYTDRTITRIEDYRITLDEPLTCALEQQYGGGTVYAYTWPGRIANVGIEHLRGISDFDADVTASYGGSTYYADENHAWTFIQLNDGVENAWVRSVTSRYFAYACVSTAGGKYSGVRNLTVRDCTSLDPVSIITGGRRYAFVLNDSQFCLIQNCTTSKDRHQFVTQSLTTGPNVFVDGRSDTAYNDAGPHFKWCTGAIWDNITVTGNNINVQNRGNWGTAHGWAGANELVWNSTADGFIVQNPPTARNWLIGSIGPIRQGTAYVGPHDDGTYDSHGTNVFPNSLYYAQLQDRLAAPDMETREYRLGVIDEFTNASDVVTIDPVWSNAVHSAASGQPLDPFNVVTDNHWIPFTFGCALDADEQVVAATLSLALRASSSAANDVIYFDSTTNSISFSSLGWLPIGTGTNTTVRVLDLGGRLDLLANGALNVAVAGDAGIDWAMLELQVAPVQSLSTNFILPEADAFVRGGAYADENYGSDTVIAVKTDSSADVQRRAYLRWDLAGFPADFQQARIRLVPLSVSTNGYEHGIAVAASNAWDEQAINWNNQPGGGQRFATWIPAAHAPVEFVVTPQAQSALAYDGKLSLELFSLSNAGGSGYSSYASRENTNPAYCPQLLLIYSHNAPTADFSAAPTNGGAPLTVNFTDTSTGMITNRFWSFGDGTTTNVTTANLTHTYSLPGTNSVQLIVSDAGRASTNIQTGLIIAAPVDTVGDGVPDWWRAQYFGGNGSGTNAGSGAACDYDNDGMDNRTEYLAGTDPVRPASRLALISLTQISNQVRLKWIGGSSARQWVEYCDTLAGANDWKTVYTNNPPTSITNTMDDVAAVNSRFYRIKAGR